MNPQGQFGDYFMYNALGGGDYFNYRMRLEDGIFGKGNLQAVMGHMRKNFKDPKARWYAMSQMFGITMHQAQSFDNLNIKRNGGNSAFLNTLNDISGGKIENISGDKLGLMAKIFESTGAERGELLKDSRIAGLAKEKGWTGATDAKTILKGISEGTIQKTPTERMLSELVTLDNTLVEYGKQAVGELTKLVAVTNKVTRWLDPKGELFVTDNDKAALKKAGSFMLDPFGGFISGIANVMGSGENGGPGRILGDVPGQVASGIANSFGPTLKGTAAGVEASAVGVKDALEPIFEGLGNLFTQLGKQLHLEVKLTDERTAGDGNSTRVRK